MRTKQQTSLNQISQPAQLQEVSSTDCLISQEENTEYLNMNEEAEVVFAPADADNEDQEDDNNEEEYDESEDLSSPLLAAVMAGDLTTTRSLLEGGADKNITTNWGRTAMWHAAKLGHLGIVRLLVEQGADKEKVRHDGDGTPLCIASHMGHLGIVRYLLEQGAD